MLILACLTRVTTLWFLYLSGGWPIAARVVAREAPFDSNVCIRSTSFCFRPKMSSEIEGHIARKYEIKKRLGKGVRLN